MNHEEGNDSIAAVYFKKYLDNEQEPPKEYKVIAQNLVDSIKNNIVLNIWYYSYYIQSVDVI